MKIPHSPKVRVVWTKDKVNYSSVIPNPGSRSTLQTVMLSKKVGMSQVARVEAVWK